MIVRRWLAPSAREAERSRSVRAYCQLDDWSFDPRYTDGRCPICGWAPPGAPTAPAWLVAARRFEWELAGLVALTVVLVILGVLVARAAGYHLPVFGAQAPAGAAQVASPARTTHVSPAPQRSPSPSTSPSAKPSPTR